MSKNLTLVPNDINQLPNNIEAEQAVIGSVLTSNEIFDLTVGVFDGSDLVITASGGTIQLDLAQKKLFPSESLMMREKIQNYSQFAQILLGDSTSQFTAPFTDLNNLDENKIDVAMFMPFKRLFSSIRLRYKQFIYINT